MDKPSKLYTKLLDAFEEIARLKNSKQTLDLVRKYKNELLEKGELNEKGD